MHEHSCEINVARLEPLTPIPRAKIRIGSGIIFIIALSR